MMCKNLALVGLFASAVMGEKTNLRNNVAEDVIEQLDLELEIDGERQLFPLVPGVKCPTGHTCNVRTFTKAVTTSTGANMMPITGIIKDSYKTTLAATVDWQELDSNFSTMVNDNDKCTRRAAMAKAAGIVAGLSAATVGRPAFAAETKEVLMGSDSGLLVFVPQRTKICKGDSVKWINNKAGPHNVVFDEDAIPAGVDQEAISMSDQLGEEGDSFSMSFDTAGSYEYYCEPHRGAGMQGFLTVE